MSRTASTVTGSADRRRNVLVAALAATTMTATGSLAAADPTDFCRSTGSQPDSRPNASGEIHSSSPHMDAYVRKITQLPPGVPSWHDAAILDGQCGQSARLQLALKLHLWAIAASAAARGGLGADTGQH
jgi:hypothetical protein